MRLKTENKGETNNHGEHMASNAVHMMEQKEECPAASGVAAPPGAAGAQSVDRALGVLSAVGRASADGMSLSDLIRETGLNKPTVRRLLLALMRGRMVEQNAVTRKYFLGEETYILGTFAAQRHGIFEHCAGALTRLSRETGDATFVSVRRGHSSLCLHREEGSYPIRTHALMSGQLHPLGVGAGSLAMLAALPDEEVERALAANADLLASDYAGITPDSIRRHVGITRDNGVALNPGLLYPDSWGLGIALRRPDGALAGALSLAAIESRMQPARREELVARLRTHARNIETSLARFYAARAGS
jgi:DNA-binding IclR family transcriptional regulator